MKSVPCIDMHDHIDVSKADATERDMYGGAVNVTFRYDGPAGQGGAVHVVDLDPDGVRLLIAALSETLRESTADYESIRTEMRRVLG